MLNLRRLFYSQDILDTPINFTVTESGTIKSKHTIASILKRQNELQKTYLSKDR